MTQTVLLTGATGFVGRHVLRRLAARGRHVTAIASPAGDPIEAEGRIDWHRADLTDPMAAAAAMEAIRPSHWLHLAWIATPGRFWTSPDNLRWLSAGALMAEAFYRCGGRYALGVGTCAEYGGDRANCVEGQTLIAADTVYGRAKIAMGEALAAAAQAGEGRAGWARVFFPYGPGEPPGRLIPSVIDAVLAGREVETSHGRQIRDFIHVEDVAEALFRLLEAEAEGAVNVGSGEPVALRDVIGIITGIAGGADLIHFGARAAPENEPPALVASVERLQALTGWRPQTDLHAGLARSIAAGRISAGLG